MQLCIILSLSRIYNLVHFVQYGRIIVKLNLYERFQSKIQNERFAFVRSRCCYAEYINKMRATRAARLFFFFLTNDIIVLWRCRSRSGRH